MTKLSAHERMTRTVHAYRRAYRLCRNWAHFASWRYRVAGATDAHYQDATTRADNLADACNALRAFYAQTLHTIGGAR